MTAKKAPSRNNAAKRATLQAKFLAAYAASGNISHAAKLATVGRRDHYDWMADPTQGTYQAAFAQAQEQAIDALEREARRRAIEGTKEPVFHQGKIVGHIRKYSDVLLIFLLKGALPAKYRERFEHSGDSGTPLLPGVIRIVTVPDGEEPV